MFFSARAIKLEDTSWLILYSGAWFSPGANPSGSGAEPCFHAGTIGETMTNRDAENQDADKQEVDNQETDSLGKNGPETNGSKTESHNAQSQNDDDQEAPGLEHDEDESMEKIWPQLRTLLVFQIKLYIDAFRDLLLSALTLGAFIIDLVQQNQGEDSYFERVLKFGRKTEVTINLFNQYTPDEQSGTTVDSILQEVEEKVKKQAERARDRENRSGNSSES